MDPVLIDRDLQFAVRTANTWQRSLKLSPEDHAQPLARYRLLLGKARFDEVQALADDDPLRQPLLRCIARYAEMRINHSWLTRAAIQSYSELHAITEPVKEPRTLASLLDAALRDAPVRADWLKAWLACSGPSSETQVGLWQRRQEIALRLGQKSADELELPIAEPSLIAAARAWLDRTQPMADEFHHDNIADWLTESLGVEATEGWPAVLNERALANWFRHSRLLNDLAINTPPFPQAYGASSYLRALAELGFAIREAGASRKQPFCVAHDPYSLESHSMAMRFARLLAAPSFIEKNLSLSQRHSSQHQRCVARITLLESRNRAVKVLLRSHALAGERSFREAYPALVHETLGLTVADRALGVLLTPRVGDAAAFCGMLLGEAEFHRITEAHDEDWFRNPRAVDELRSELLLPPETTISPEQLTAGADLLLAQLSQSL